MKKDKNTKNVNGTLQLNGITVSVSIEVPESKLKDLFGTNFGKVQLSTLKAGETFKTGDHEWVVLEQSGDTTAVIHKDCLENLRHFDDNSNNWIASEIRNWLNIEFAKEIEDEIGADNLVEHTPDLSTDDGTLEYKKDNRKDKVSLISCNAYRKYRKFIPKTDKWYWTLTAYSSEVDTFFVRYVDRGGALGYDCVHISFGGVRPFCIFSSKIYVTKGE